MKKPLIAAHRGVSGGNIPCNTIASYDIALSQGADIVELDVSRTADGKLFVFHPGMESAHLLSPKLLKDMTADEVSSLRYVNTDNTPTQFGISSLEDVLEHLKGKCLINVDKFFFWPGEIGKVIRSLGMQDQVIVKTGDDPALFDEVERVASDMPYMVITRSDTFSDTLLKRNLRYVGTEVLFAEDTSPLASPAYVDAMHAKGLKVWVNGIVYDYKAVLSGGHNDDISVTGHPDEGWGWLCDRGYDIIQTDWTLPLKLYMDQKYGK